MTHSSDVVYALDIGVYNVGIQGQMLACTTAAWCRAAVGTSKFDSLQYCGTPDRGDIQTGKTTWRCGRNIGHLAEAIATDFCDGNRVALGFEAPMWLPFERTHQSGRLFTSRFDEEKGYEWYRQSGAAATVKAISLGMMLFSKLVERYPRLACTTDCSQWRDKTLMLFEAFVAGPYKIPPPPSFGTRASNEWDAFIAALAWGAEHAGLHTPDRIEPIVLHRAGSHCGDCLPVWKTICDTVALSDAYTRPPDCQVVALKAPPPKT